MSRALPVVSGAEVVGTLTMRKDERVAIVPMYRELAQGTLGSILRQAGLSREEFLARIATVE